MSLDMSEKCHLVPVRSPRLFEQNVLKAVSRTQIGGSCRVYAGKTRRNSKLKAVRLQARSEEQLEALLQMTLFEQHCFVSKQKHYRRRSFWRC